MLEWIQGIDWLILRGIQNTIRCGFLDFLMPGITLLGNGGAIWIFSACGLMLSKKYRKYGFAMIGALAFGAMLCSLWLKPWIARPRPCWLEGISLLIENPADYSFPSGHTMSSVIGAFVLTAANRKFGLFAVPAAVMIAFSRLYLYVHFPSDVLAAALLGAGIGMAAICMASKAGTSEKIL